MIADSNPDAAIILRRFRRPHRLREPARGFSLVEAALVLVVIGLILGAVLQGRSLVDSAEYKSFRQSLRDYRSAFLTFRDRFDALPGDFADASGRIDGGLPDGDGDGVIEDGPACTADTDEACRAWQHLRAAGMLSGNPDTAGSAASPEHTYNGVVSAYFTGTGSNGDFGNNMLVQNVPVEVARRLDRDEDDDRCDDGRITAQTCGSPSAEWPDVDTVDLVYAL